VKLFWKEVREDMIPSTLRTIWDELPEASVDTSKLEHLFESRAKDLLTKVRYIASRCRILRPFFVHFLWVTFGRFNLYFITHQQQQSNIQRREKQTLRNTKKIYNGFEKI